VVVYPAVFCTLLLPVLFSIVLLQLCPLSFSLRDVAIGKGIFNVHCISEQVHQELRLGR